VKKKIKKKNKKKINGTCKNENQKDCKNEIKFVWEIGLIGR